MSNQQGMYYPQEQEPRERSETNAVNTDPREQPQPQAQNWQEPIAEAYSGYERGYGPDAESPEYNAPFEQRQRYGEKLSSSQKRRSSKKNSLRLDNPVWPAIILGVLVINMLVSLFSGNIVGLIVTAIILATLFYFFAMRRSSPTSGVALPPQIFAVQEYAQLTVKNPLGAISVVRSMTGNVEVSARQQAGGIFGSLLNSRLEATQTGETISVIAQQTSWRPSKIDLTISVPPNCDVKIVNNAGTIEIEELDGSANIETNAGSITINNSHLRKNSHIKTNLGDIKFTGHIDPPGIHRFESNLGDIKVTLPIDSSFVVQTKTDLGDKKNDFGSNIVGTAPHAMLELHTNLGDVKVKRAL